jgi:hypothetical protein
MQFIIRATYAVFPKANKEDSRDINIKRGAPGGCPACNLYEVAINSPQSQRLVVGSTVRKYTMVAIAKHIQPAILFNFLNSMNVDVHLRAEKRKMVFTIP